MPVLLADIGGTHSRFALSEGGGDPVGVRAFANDEFASLEAAVDAYLRAGGSRPAEAVLAVAGPVTGPEIVLTNRSWRFHLDDLKLRFGFARVQAVNDFEVQALALTRLGPAHLRRIGAAGELSPGPKVVLGPGTGLGVAALASGPAGPTVIATEAGHVSFGPAHASEEAIFARLREAGPVSAETVLSGPGLCRLHAALNRDTAAMAAGEIVAAAQAGDARARETTQMFMRLLGRFAGDMMLVFRATGGVYVTGGVAQALGACFDDDVFRAAFERHPPYVPLLAGTATWLITHPQPGLLGCAVLAASLTLP